MSPEEKAARRRRLKFALGCVLAVGCVGALVFGMKALESKVLNTPRPYGTGVRVRLVDVPMWMPESLATAIGRTIAQESDDFYDPSLIARAYDQAAANPWVRSVMRVSKHPTASPIQGIVELHAEYRMPVAAVLLSDGRTRAYVDAQGVLVPDDPALGSPPKYLATFPAVRGQPPRAVFYSDMSEAPSDAPIQRRHYIEIQGVQAPPPIPGERWRGQDLEDALRLVELLRLRSYCTQIEVIDVHNHGGRLYPAQPREPHIRMFTAGDESSRTQINFGRFPLPGGDYDVPVERRIANLDLYAVTHGRLNYHSLIDIRFDQLQFK